MKTTFTTQHNAASTLHGSHAAHNVYSPLRRLTLLVTLLMTFALGARAASYTISSDGTNFLGINSDGTLTNITPFNASTCVWTGPDNGSGNFYMTVNGTTYYLRYNNGLGVTNRQNQATSWTINNKRLYNGNRYLQYSYGNWTTTTYVNNWTSGLDVLTELISPTKITLKDMALTVGGTGTIEYQLTPDDAYDNITFSTSNNSIATINANSGLVTGVSQGTATVTAEAYDFNGEVACTATCTVTVKQPTPTQYVFYNNGYYLAVNDARNGITRTNTFNAETCIWTGVDVGAGLYSATVNGVTYYLRLQQSTNYGNTSYTLTITDNVNQATQWTINGAKLYSDSDGRYVRYSSNSWTTTGTSTSTGTDALYPITKTSDGNPTSTITYTVGATSVSPTAATLDFANAKTAQFTADADVTKTTTTTKTATYQHSSSGGSTITPSSTVREVASETLPPAGYDWSLSSTENLTIGSGTTNTNTVTYSTASGTTKSVTLSVAAYYKDGANKVAGTAGTANITVNEKLDDPTSITAEPLTLAVDEQKSISYTLQPSNANRVIAYSGYDNTIISIDANGAVTGLKAGKTRVTLTAKKLDGTNGPTTSCMVTVTPKAPAIEFSLGTTGITATISTTEAGANICYTTNGDTPTENSKKYTAPFTVEAGVIVKAIVVVTTANDEKLVSPVAESLANAGSGIVGNTVYLYDLEDHNWTYYQSDSPISSPNPRNVKITYEGNGGAVGIDAPDQVNFVYYKTLESEGNNYPYTTIANPFSKRPSEGSGNSKTYKGFKAWRVKSITGGSITNYAVNSEIPAETDINFVFSSTYSTNCISAEIVLEAVWTTAYIVRCSVGDINNNLNNAALQGSSYETNFIVVNSGNSSSTSINANTQKSVTITMVEPDGSEDYRNSSRYINPQTITLNNALKFEYINMNNNNTTINANAMNLVLGRGIANTTSESVCANYIRGIGGNKTSSLNYQLRIESGIYNYLSFVAGRSGGGSNQGTTHSCSGTSNLVKGILGCDYDRSTTTNSLLKVQQEIIMGYYPTFAEGNENRETLRVIARSGDFTSAKNNDIADADESFYLSLGGDQTYVGRRTLIIEGGQFLSIAGGIDEENPSDALSVYIRMKGGIVRGAIYGSGAFAATSGHRKIVVTGGIVRGWIAAGCNGTSTNQSGGILPSDTYVYVGGNATVGYKDGTTIKINTSEGGNVFGAGSGNSSQAETGRVNNSTVVIADDAYIQKNVYGGGNYGYTQSTANILVAGGVINGSVFGGSNQKQGATINLTTTGGQVLGGLYGGSNIKGTISNNVTMQINGGQVGTSSQTANIHGGGYGKDTKVNGDVTLTLGANTTDPGVTVYGDVYGGSALGTVNDASSDKTKVTLNCGTINGSLYGGGLGDATEAANVYGAVTVTVNGGSVKKTSVEGSGGVYGANNIKGAPQSSVTVDIYGTDPAPAEGQYALYAVYGGGNNADYTYGYGYPKVAVHNCNNSIEYVYGGGNAAAVAATDVTIWGGDVIGNVFGGGNGTVSPANVNGDATTKIYGGTILNVYGGSNAAGTINGDIKLTINSMKEEGSSDKQPCTMDIGSVYGGGNLADMNGNISVSLGCINHIKELYGGARNANIGTDTQNSNINLAITSGHFDRVFGGNNLGGAIKGSITVNIEETGCNPITIGELYGGGNLAAYSVYGYDAEGNYKESGTKLYNDPVVNILSFSSIGRVFGGGLGNKAVMVGSPTVNINEVVGTNANNTEWPYLGQTISYTDESSVTLPTRNSGAIGAIGTVFGGGNAAPVIGNTQVNIGTTTGKADIRGNVYGGGNQANVTGKTNVVIGE